MIPDFPHNIRIRLARLKKNCCLLMLLCLCPVGCLILAAPAPLWNGLICKINDVFHIEIKSSALFLLCKCNPQRCDRLWYTQFHTSKSSRKVNKITIKVDLLIKKWGTLCFYAIHNHYLWNQKILRIHMAAL